MNNMETEVVEFLSSLQSHEQKEDFQKLSLILQEKSKEWMCTLQQQLDKVFINMYYMMFY